MKCISSDNETDAIDWLDSGVDLDNMSASYLNRTHAGMHTPIAIILSILCVCGTLGNLLVAIVMIKKKKKLAPSYFILSLAVIDGVVCTILIPLEVKGSLTMFNFFSNGATCKLFKWFECSVLLISAFTTVAIAVDRYLAICKPFKYAASKVKAAGRARIAGVTSVVLGALLPIPILSCYDFITITDGITICDLNYNSVCDYFVAWYQPVIVLVCVAIVAVFYVIIYLDIRRTRGRLSMKLNTYSKPVHKVNNTEEPSPTPNLQQVNLTRKRQSFSLGGGNYRTVKLFVLVTLVFFFTWLPYCVLNLNLGYLFFKTHTELSVNLFEVISKLHLLHFILNPFIYAFVNRSFRKDCRELFISTRKAKHKTEREVYAIDGINC